MTTSEGFREKGPYDAFYDDLYTLTQEAIDEAAAAANDVADFKDTVAQGTMPDEAAFESMIAGAKKAGAADALIGIYMTFAEAHTGKSITPEDILDK